ncbi:MAG: glycogen/starch synthase [Prevotellaceae bacterium]|nr:glycogen/starch synthase [Prevotellaceae bacterium]
MQNPRVLFICSELMPYVPENEMSKISRQLPQGIQELGSEVRVFMPRYGCINERRNQLHEVIRLSGMNMVINDTDHPLIIKVASITAARMQVYFIDNEDYFQRKAMIRSDSGEFFADNDERVVFFARGVLETVKKLRWSPDIIHCHGWFSYMAPLFLKKVYQDDPLFASTKVVVSLYDDEFPEEFDPGMKKKTLMEGIKSKDVDALSTPSYTGLAKLAISYSNGVIAGTEAPSEAAMKYAKSLKKPILKYQMSEQYIQEYAKFYKKILAND